MTDDYSDSIEEETAGFKMYVTPRPGRKQRGPLKPVVEIGDIILIHEPVMFLTRTSRWIYVATWYGHTELVRTDEKVWHLDLNYKEDRDLVDYFWEQRRQDIWDKEFQSRSSIVQPLDVGQ